jgi:hypothetical protein
MQFVQFWLNISGKTDLGEEDKVLQVLLKPLAPPWGRLSSGDIWFELEKSSKSQCAALPAKN